ncbi:MAG: hypothetical protein LH619_07935 [Chitinophagaceae bacterium]|nr:hypothetical protein [Chitinophagaceae bacterium]
MSEAKIRLSQKEMEMVSNAGLILTKNSILQKVNHLLATLQIKQQQHLESLPAQLPDQAMSSSPKISKGENYKGLPYMILDYPRYFDKENICAIRTMFWWGNFFSVTLHLSGTPKQETEEKLITAYPLLKERDYYCYINDDQWQHHFETDNYISLTEISNTVFENLVTEKPFIKLANKIPLEQWDNAEEMLLTYFKQIIEVLAD